MKRRKTGAAIVSVLIVILGALCASGAVRPTEAIHEKQDAEPAQLAAVIAVPVIQTPEPEQTPEPMPESTPAPTPEPAPEPTPELPEETEEPEPEIDLHAVAKEIRGLQSEIKDIDAKLKPYFKELGLDFPFA